MPRIRRQNLPQAMYAQDLWRGESVNSENLHGPPHSALTQTLDSGPARPSRAKSTV